MNGANGRLASALLGTGNAQIRDERIGATSWYGTEF
jgi:hypothetical protein